MIRKGLREKLNGTISLLFIFLFTGNMAFPQQQLRFSADGHVNGSRCDVYTIRYSADGKYMVTASKDHSAKVWDVASGKMLLDLSMDDEVRFAVFSPDGKKVAAAALDKSVIVWDRETGKRLMKVREVSRALFVFFSPDGKRIVTQPEANHPEVWDIETRKLLFTLKAHTKLIMEIAYSADGKYIATTSMDVTTIIWDAQTGDRLHTIKGSGELLKGYTFAANKTISPRFSPDGKMIAFCSGDLAQICDLRSGETLQKLKGDGFCHTVAFSPGGETIVTSDNGIKIWSVKTGKLLRSLEMEKPDGATLSPDGKITAGYNMDEVVLWDAASGRPLHTFPIRGLYYMNNFSLAFSPGGAAVAVAAQDGAHLWKTATGEKIRRLGSKERIIKAVYSTDGKTLLVSSGGGSRAFDAATDKLLFALKGEVRGFSPDGKTLVTVSEETAYLYDAATGKLRHTLTGHAGIINLAVFGPHSKILATTDEEACKIWDVATGKLIDSFSASEVKTLSFNPGGDKVVITKDGRFSAFVINIKTGENTRSLQGDYGVDMRTGLFAPDGKSILTVSGIFGQVIKWDARTGNRLGVLNGPVDGDGITETAFGGEFSPGGEKLVINFREDYDGPKPDASVNKVFSADAAKQLFTLEGESDEVHFSSDGKFLFGYMDKAAMIWDAATGRMLHRLEGHGYNIHSIACSPDGRHIITTAVNGSLIVWDVASGKMLLQQFIYDNFENATTDGNGSFDATAGARDKVYGVNNSVITGYDGLKEHEDPGLWSAIMGKN